MQDSRINYIVVGGFVTAMLAAFVIIIAVLAGRTGSTDKYYTVYDNVTGLKFGTAVLYEGFQIGQVETIEPMTDTAMNANKAVLFKITMEVKKGWRVPEDSVARATVSGLLSAMTVDIRSGQSDKLIPPGGQIRGISATNFFATLTELSSQFGDLSNESLKPMLGSLNHLIMQLDKTTAQNLPPILEDIRVLTGGLALNVPELTASLKKSANILEKDILKPENRGKLDAILGNVETTSANLARVSGELEETRKVIARATENINRVINENAGNIDESIRDLRYTLGTAARYIDEISQNADTTTRNLAEFSRSIRDNPGLLLSGKSPPDQAKTQTQTRKER